MTFEDFNYIKYYIEIPQQRTRQEHIYFFKWCHKLFDYANYLFYFVVLFHIHCFTSFGFTISVLQIAALQAQGLPVAQVLEAVQDQVAHHQIHHHLVVRHRELEQKEGNMQIVDTNFFGLFLK